MSIKQSVTRWAISRFPNAMSLYRAYRHIRQLGKPASETKYGFRFIGNQAMIDGSFEPVETAILRSLMPNFNSFLNIGANIGYYCCLARKEGLPVIAFEPEAANVDYICRNLVENGWQGDVEIYPVALAEKPGVLELYGGGVAGSLIKGWSGVPEKYKKLVPISTLDRVLGARLNGRKTLVVMDVEGAELSVLKGASAFLRSAPKPVWFVEITIDENQPAGVKINPNLLETFELFFQAGYICYAVSERSRPVQVEEIKKIVASSVNTIDTHNFLFFDPAEKIKL